MYMHMYMHMYTITVNKVDFYKEIWLQKAKT